ncbi:MAG: CDP-alcohol phosphatidyltransferase family protein [Ktedonobacteraceae bacterium]
MLHLRLSRGNAVGYKAFLQHLASIRFRVVTSLQKLAVTPNQLTTAGVTICIASGLLAALGANLAVVGVVFIVGATFDALDGIAARVQRSTRPAFGGFADTMADRIGEVALLVGFVIRFTEPHLLRLTAVAGFLGLLTSFTKAAAAEYGLNMNWPEAKVYGRPGRVVIQSVFLVLSGLRGDDQIGIMVMLAILCAFNAATLAARLSKVITADEANGQ